MDDRAQLLRPEEAASRLGIQAHTLQAWRTRGIGPKYVKLTPRAVRYNVRDLEAWLVAHTMGPHAA
jgi:predicted DNA-binding transcriptional regulator AlpA